MIVLMHFPKPVLNKIKRRGNDKIVLLNVALFTSIYLKVVGRGTERDVSSTGLLSSVRHALFVPS